MSPPINIDGTDITGASIDGQDVSAITVDGTEVFSPIPDSVVNFEGNTTSPTASNWSGPSGNTGSLSTTQSPALFGDFSGQFAGGNGRQISYTRDSEYQPNQLLWHLQIQSRTGNNSDNVDPRAQDAAGNLSIRIRFNGDGNIQAPSGTFRGQWSTGTLFRVEASNIDYSNDQYDLEIIDLDSNTTVVSDTGVPFSQSASGVKDMIMFNDTGGPNTIIDDLLADPI